MPKSRLYGIWYVTIALGFLFLGLYRQVRLHGQGVVIHLVIAALFGVLAFLQFRSKN